MDRDDSMCDQKGSLDLHWSKIYAISKKQNDDDEEDDNANALGEVDIENNSSLVNHAVDVKVFDDDLPTKSSADRAYNKEIYY